MEDSLFKNDIDNLATLAEMIEQTGLPQYFGVKEEVKSRLLDDLFCFCFTLVLSRTQDLEETEEQIAEFKSYICTDQLDMSDTLAQPFRRKSLLLVCLVDRLWPIDGRRGHILRPFNEIYVLAIRHGMGSKHELEVNWMARYYAFVREVDALADKLLDWSETTPKPLDDVDLPPFWDFQKTDPETNDEQDDDFDNSDYEDDYEDEYEDDDD